MKKKYEKPQVEDLGLCIQDDLLISASGGATTDEILSRGLDGFDEDIFDGPAMRP